MRDELSNAPRQDNECMVINTDSSKNAGTRLTCLFIKNGTSYYFDPHGFPPPLEVVGYCKEPIYYNTFPIHNFNEVICGHYCIHVLYRLSSGDNLYDVCYELYK